MILPLSYFKGEIMGYNQDKDKLINFFELETEGGKSLQFSIFSYNEGEPKLQITRSFLKVDETVGYAKMGRLSISEVEFMRDKMDELLKVMKQ